MRLLVTGGAGFLGSLLVKELAKNTSNEIYIFDSFAHGYPKKLPKRKNIKDFIVANIKDYSAICRAIEKANPEIVIHLAAHITRPESVGEFRACAEVNHLGTANLLDGCLNTRNKPHKIIYASSEAIRNPHSHYGISKLSAERLLESVCPLMGIDLGILRFSEIYGLSPSPTSKSLVNFLVDNMVTGRSIAVYNVKAKKDYVHVGDAIKACKLAISHDFKKSNVFNVDIGPGVGIITKDLIEKLKILAKFKGEFKYLENPGVRNVDSISDPEPASKILNFKCESDLDTELENLIVRRRKDLK